MKDIGCLTINEDKSNTVHIGKLKDGKRPLPRVLLIDVQTLRDNAEKYELFAEQAREYSQSQYSTCGIEPQHRRGSAGV